MDPSSVEGTLLAHGPAGILALTIVYLFRTHATERAALQAQIATLIKDQRDEMKAMVDRIREDAREQIAFNRSVIERISTLTESLERKFRGGR